MAGLFLLLRTRFGWRMAVLIGAALLPVLFVFFAGRQTDLSTSGGTGQERIQLWSEGLVQFRQSPLFGIGRDRFDQEVGLVAHNSYVHAFAELGFLGGMFFVGAFVLALGSLYRLSADGRHILDPDLRRMHPYRDGRRRRLRGQHDVADAVLHHSDLHHPGPGRRLPAHDRDDAAGAGAALRRSPAGATGRHRRRRPDRPVRVSPPVPRSEDEVDDEQSSRCRGSPANGLRTGRVALRPAAGAHAHSPGPRLAAYQSPRAVAVPRVDLHPGLARREGALQADPARRRLGGAATRP